MGKNKDLKQIESQLIRLYEYETKDVIEKLKKNAKGSYSQTLIPMLGLKANKILESIAELENIKNYKIEEE